MHAFVKSQEKRIRDLESAVNLLENEIKELKARPPVHVGTIEYKFDQLKVETLEGTLNIGLNPATLSDDIEEFEVNNKPFSSTDPMKNQMERTVEIEQTLFDYLNTDLELLIRKYEKELNINVDESYIIFIKDDIKKQLPARISHYFKQIPPNEQTPQMQPEVRNRIEEQMRKDIEKAVFTFLKNLPVNRKE